MACSPSSLDFPLHPNFSVLAQRRRGIFRDTHKAATEARRVPIRRRSPSRHQSLPPRAQPTIKALHLDRRSRQNHRRRQKRAQSVRFDPLASTVWRSRRFHAGDCGLCGDNSGEFVRERRQMDAMRVFGRNEPACPASARGRPV